ncbi:GrpB family protein [Devosia sp. ZB163]|uniref:GrpB family protein n=1 Tax=Devosia sp. ZB163 TaxID=3025938 RepID=UPI00235F5299|nr:GrpB family protein [Devosia sp. ZB163]MDC9824521.1 GrpB family protein [Devosia sp. ZB163]
MPPPVPVELQPHNPGWAAAADQEAGRLRSTLGRAVLDIHHIGSTAIPGLVAKPTIDLVPVVGSLDALDAARPMLEALGYEWWGEYGLPGRRYCTLSDAPTGKRLVHLHFYENGDPAITRHVAFRDYLRARPDLIAEYEALKQRCREAHAASSHSYSACKGDWIKRIEAEAMAALG